MNKHESTVLATATILVVCAMTILVKTSDTVPVAQHTPAPQPAITQTHTEAVSYTFQAIATVYNNEASQCDSTPDICADGTRAEYGKRICAVSRDQLARWGGVIEYGDQIVVTGAGKWDGVWNVHDTMNRRFGATSPTFDRGVAGVVKAHALKPVDVDGVAHIDFLVADRLGKWDVTVTVVGDGERFNLTK